MAAGHQGIWAFCSPESNSPTCVAGNGVLEEVVTVQSLSIPLPISLPGHGRRGGEGPPPTPPIGDTLPGLQNEKKNESKMHLNVIQKGSLLKNTKNLLFAAIYYT